MRNSKAWTLILPIALLVVVILALAGCGGSPVLSTPKSLVEKSIRLSDGREIACVVYVEYNVVCDWDHPISDINYQLEDEN